MSTELMDDVSKLGALTKAEIDMQIATAKQYPRSVKHFVEEATQMACMDEEIAGDCIYALPRGGKVIEGPSARFAEIVASCWGNCRAGARVIDEGKRFVTAQGMFQDVERNVVIVYESSRRITGKNGKRFNDDMVNTTANAACSIALRNAVLKGIPKAFWRGIYDAAKQTAIGNTETLAAKRSKMLKAFANMGAFEDVILSFLKVDTVEDITLENLAVLRGIYSAVKEGEQSIDTAFREPADVDDTKRVHDSTLNQDGELFDKSPDATEA